MTWLQLHFQCEKSNIQLAESLLMAQDALSISLEDAGDQPLFEPLPGESPLWDDVIVTALFEAIAIDDPESHLHQIGSRINASRVWMTLVADKDWEREWMSHYHPIECANNLWIIPNWLTPPNPNAINILMDPGLAFGTGYHATTRLCLDWLTEQTLKDKIVIDYGCGSGILGVAALLLGAKQVYAVDIDPQAILATQQNAKRNKVAAKLKAFLADEFAAYCQDTSILPVDVIIANILAKPLIQLAPYFATLLKTDGDIVLSGLIREQIIDVKSVYKDYFSLTEPYSFNELDDSHWQRLSGVRIARNAS